MLTRDDVIKALPSNLKSAATQELTDRINNAVADPVVNEQIRENFVSYARIMQDGKFKTEDYLKAVTYVTHKLMGMNNQDAWAATFPQRHAQLVAQGVPPKTIAAYVTSYHKGKLVNLIMEQSLTPMWIINQDAYQKAINVQVELMQTAQSEKVRSDAANSILQHLAKPKDAVPTVAIQVGESQGMVELKSALLQLADRQKQLIENGVTAKELAASPLIEGKAEKVDLN